MIRTLALMALLSLAAIPARAADRAWCVYGNTTVESWDDAQMRTRYGSGACRLGGGSDARKFFEQNFGGTGKKCSC